MSVEKQIQEILERRVNRFVKAGQSKELLDKVGKEAVSQVVKRTRLGQGVRPPGGGAASKLLPLKDITKKYRSRYSNNLSPFTRDSRSNLTATGQLLDSITYRILNGTKSKIIQLFFKDNRTYELNGGRARVRNDKLAGHVQKQGRSFFYLAQFEIKKIRSIIFDALDKL